MRTVLLSIFTAITAAILPACVVRLNQADFDKYCVPHFNQAAVDEYYWNIHRREADLVDASAVLYVQGVKGDLRPLCPLTAFDKTANGTYRFVTMAACVADDDVATRRVKIRPGNWFIKMAGTAKAAFVEAKVIAAGFRKQNDDFAVLEAKITAPIKTVPISASDPMLGEDLTGAIRDGRDVLIFRGYVVIVGPRQMATGMLIISTDLGSHTPPTPLLSRRTASLAAFPLSDSPGAYLPASRFLRFWKAVQAGKYPWLPAKKGK